MKKLLLAVATAAVSFSAVYAGYSALQPRDVEEAMLARCNPYGTCKACTNCKYCQHCAKNGGKMLCMPLK